MPLRKGKSKDILTYNIGEMMRSPTFAADKSKKKKQQMAVAASYRQARESGAVLPRKRNPKKKGKTLPPLTQESYPEFKKSPPLRTFRGRKEPIRKKRGKYDHS
jgi:hypothetical protein